MNEVVTAFAGDKGYAILGERDEYPSGDDQIFGLHLAASRPTTNIITMVTTPPALTFRVFPG
jgi:hypothetical protein